MKQNLPIPLNRYQIDAIARECVGLKVKAVVKFPWEVELLRTLMRPSLEAVNIRFETKNKVKNSQKILQQKIGRANTLLLIKRVNKLLLLFV